MLRFKPITRRWIFIILVGSVVSYVWHNGVYGSAWYSILWFLFCWFVGFVMVVFTGVLLYELNEKTKRWFFDKEDLAKGLTHQLAYFYAAIITLICALAVLVDRLYNSLPKD